MCMIIELLLTDLFYTNRNVLLRRQRMLNGEYCSSVQSCVCTYNLPVIPIPYYGLAAMQVLV